MKWIGCFIVLGVLALPVVAQPTVDGTLDGSYGAARAVQRVETGFGDNASEWDAAYATLDSGKLYLMFTGNLEGNFNKLEVFIDSVIGGSNVFPATPGNDGAGVMAGMTFDTGFTPEYHLIARRGNAGSDKFDLDFAVLGTPDFGAYADVFGGTQEGAGSTGTTAGANASPIDVAYDNSNVAGIDGCDTPAGSGCTGIDPIAALAVTTGLELGIDLADLGSPAGGGQVKVMLLQNNDNHDFLSNQTLGGLPPGQGNLGSPASGVDFNQYGRDQFFVVPEPAALALCVLGGLSLWLCQLRRRRS